MTFDDHLLIGDIWCSEGFSPRLSTDWLNLELFHIVIWFRPPKKQKQNKTCFTGGQTCQVGSVGRAFFWCFFCFFFLVAKMTLKHDNFEKNLTFFAEKFWENIFTYFQKFSAKIFRFWSKNGWFCKILEKVLKKICQNGKFGSVMPVKQGFFPWSYGKDLLNLCYVSFKYSFVCFSFIAITDSQKLTIILWTNGLIVFEIKLEQPNATKLYFLKMITNVVCAYPL